MTEPYLQYLDFRTIKKTMIKNENQIKKEKRDPLKDLEQVPEEILDFFNDVLTAESTSDLDKYTDELLENADRLLEGTGELLEYINNILNDRSILAPSHRDTLCSQMKTRALQTARRVL